MPDAAQVLDVAAPAADPDLTRLASPRMPAIGRLWPAAAAVGAGLLFAFKLLRVARGDTTVALAVAQASDKTAVFAGLLVELAPLLILLAWGAGCLTAAAAPAILAKAARERDDKAGRRGFCLLIVGGCVLAVAGWLELAVPSWPSLLLAAVVPVVAVGREYRRQRRGTRRSSTAVAWATRSIWRAALALLTAVALAGLLLMDGLFTGVLSEQMWLPAHKLVTADRKSTVGYVLSRDNGILTVLRDDDRTVVLVSSANVIADELCETAKQTDTRSAWDAWRHLPQPSLPPCST